MAITTILQSIIDETAQVKERIAAAAFTPGHILEVTSANKYQKHSAASGQAILIVALENTASGGVAATAYVANETARAVYPRTGDVLKVWLKDGQSVTANTTLLVSNGDGTVKAAAGTEDDLEILGITNETAAPSGADVLINITAV